MFSFKRRARFAVLLAPLLLVTVLAGWVSASPLYQISAQTDGGKKIWKIELASTPESRSRGLMFVKSMPAYNGMLFRFDANRQVSMWMKNTYISLDMVFLNESGHVAHIHKGAVPHSLDIISSRFPVRYVLEINSGEAEKSGLRPGIQMLHPWFAASD